MTLPYPIELPVKNLSINLFFDGGGGDKRSKRGGLSMICSRCKTKVSYLVKKFESINETGGVETFEYENSICDICVGEEVLIVKEKNRVSRRSNHNA